MRRSYLYRRREGRPLTKESFGNLFKDACKAAGVPGSAHGVRKLAATRMANNGATEAQLMAVFGWTDPKMAAHYTRTANRRRLAADSIETLNARETSIPALAIRCGQQEENANEYNAQFRNGAVERNRTSTG
jgi:integrase